MLVTLGCQRVNIVRVLSTNIFFIDTPAVSCSLCVVKNVKIYKLFLT